LGAFGAFEQNQPFGGSGRSCKVGARVNTAISPNKLNRITDGAVARLPPHEAHGAFLCF
jgi:hypothetical protein